MAEKQSNLLHKSCTNRGSPISLWCGIAKLKGTNCSMHKGTSPQDWGAPSIEAQGTAELNDCGLLGEVALLLGGHLTGVLAVLTYSLTSAA